MRCLHGGGFEEGIWFESFQRGGRSLEEQFDDALHVDAASRAAAASPPPLAEVSARAFSSTSAETPRSVAQLQPGPRWSYAQGTGPFWPFGCFYRAVR